MWQLMPVSLGARLLQVMNGLNCGCDEEADNTALCPVAFSHRTRLSAE